MFGFIAALVSFVAVATDAGRVGGITARNRSRAEKNGDAYYYDGRNKIRSTQTDEICIMEYYGGQKLVGVKTGRVYKNYDDERTDKFIRERNAKFEENGTPLFYRRCKPYRECGGKIMDYHLYERETGRPFKVLSPVNLLNKSRISIDDSKFTIVYLDEDNEMRSLSEYNAVPKKWYLNYKLGI